MEETIDFQELFQLLKKRFALIAVLAFVAAATSGVYTRFFMTPIYQTFTQLVLVSSIDIDRPLTHGEIYANIQMINTFNEVILSSMILDDVIEELGLNLSTGSLRSMMSAANRSNSQVITLTVQNECPELARDIANKTAEVFTTEVLENFNMDNVRPLELAQTPRNPISPNLTRNIAMGFLIGAAFGMFLTLLIDFLDKTVKTEQDVERLINLPVLGMIPIIAPEDFKSKRIAS